MRIEDYGSLPKYNDTEEFNIDGVDKKIAWGVLYAILGFFILAFSFISFTIKQYQHNLIQNTVILFILIAIECYLIWIMKRKIYLSKNGVKLLNNASNKKTFLYWSEIRTIGIAVSTSGKSIFSEYLYFSIDDFDNDIVVNNYYEDDGIIIAKYKPELVHCIFNYWEGEIKNLDDDESWTNYILKISRK